MTSDTPEHTVTIRDVAARAGVSPATVSNVLNRPGRVAAPTRERVLAAVAETGYVRNAAASRLRRLDNRVIGILVIDVGNSFQTALAKGAQRVVERNGFMAMLCDGDRAVDRTIRQVEFLESQRVAGVLATGSSIPGVGERLEALRRRGVAMVLVDAPASDPDQCSVAVDDADGGRLVGEHLLSLGRRRITCVTVDLDFRVFEDRIDGIRRAIDSTSAGGDIELQTVRIPIEEYDDGRRAVDALIANDSDAVFCINDHLAFATLRELLTRGIRVPDDIAVIGYDDTPLTSLTMVPLSSVRQPAGLAGETAARLLIEECSPTSEHAHQHVMFRPELVARTSTTGAPAYPRHRFEEDHAWPLTSP